MLNETMKLQILAVHAAVKPDMGLRHALIAAATGDNHQMLASVWQAIAAHACLRQLARGAKPDAPRLDLSLLERRGDTFYWQGVEIGKLLTLYKPPLPEEWQARIAYESFLDRFVNYIQSQDKVLLLLDNPYYQQYFCWHDVDILKRWQSFVQVSFSAEELSKTFVALLNSLKLTQKSGFSTPEVPILSEAQAKLLAGFYLASMNERARGSKRDRYQKSINAMKGLSAKYGQKFEDVVRYANLYTPTAREQLKATRAVVRKYVSETERLLNLSSYNSLPALLSPTVGTLLRSRDTGDNPKESCYVCGRVVENDGFEANKIILPSPSQTLQSESRQKSPLVCGTCAALSIASPIKITNQSFVIRLFDKYTRKYLLEDHLRMFVLGELNVYAGRYVMLTCTEKIDQKSSLMNKFGGEPYALWKVATLFPADVFRSYQVEAIIDGAEVVLPGRQLAWLSALMQIFGALKRHDELKDKSKLAAVQKSLRYIQHEEVIFALYELTKTFMSERQGGFSPVEASRLEDLRALHVWWLENNPFEETERRSHMGDLMDKARLFRDVAGLTGILYAFATRVRSEANQQQAEREVEKLLEKVDEPYHFIYDAAGGLKGVTASIWRRPDTYFIYDQAKALLEEIGAEVRESVENGKPSLQVSFDDISKAYTHLFETRYKTEKDQREFTYQVKLSLYARFPEYLGKKKEA